ncbi:MAG: type II secretion system GspH family protein [Patescibacteria group bacterium]|nr:type II secretion system GspH family protein [Patescibacteria group bacterium]
MFKKNKKQNRGGFTLIEVVIYLALFAFAIGFSVITFYQMIASQNQNRAATQTYSEANFLMQKIEWALVGASAINQPALGATSTTLSVNKYNFAQDPLVFSLSSGSLYLARGFNQPVVLNSSNVTVSNLVFDHLEATTSAPEGVSISLSVVASTSENMVKPSTTLQTTIYLIK